ncbi:MAG TPA: peptidoglycan DD-metalloendopeptidase family protein [Usitatibacteraceae bacterium]
MSPATRAEKTSAEIEQQRLGELRTRIEKLQRELSKSEESRSEAADALKASEKAISEVNRNLVALGREEGKIGQSLNEVQKRIQATRADVGRQQVLLDRMLRHQYMHGNADALRLVLDGQDVAEVERQLRYFSYVSRMRATLITQKKQTLTNLAELESTARLKKAQLTANADEQRKARAALQSERGARQKVVARIAADISKSRREIGRLKRDEDRLAKLVDQLAKALAQQQRSEGRTPGRVRKPGEAIDEVADASFVGRAFQTLRGKLKLPVRGELAGRFGASREEGGVTWKGLFIKSGAGQPVKAVADGRVIFADWLRGFGNLLILDHGGGYMSLYGNNESLLKQVGDMVLSGETIASVGSTGGAVESGVYFELRHEGKPFDPMKWVGK